MIAEILPHLREAAPVIVSLIVIEGLLSVDNILAIAALASRLPEHQRKFAIRLGLAGAYLYRGLALVFAAYILQYEWVKYLGAFYLIHLMAEHFSSHEAEHDADPSTKGAMARTFLGTIVAIQLMDLSLSVDNVIAAVAMSREFWVVCTGVGLGLLTLWMFATFSLKLVERFPILKHTAFLLIGYVGFILLGEMIAESMTGEHKHITAFQKFIGLAIIIVISMWHANSQPVQKFFSPILKATMVPIRLYAKFAGVVIAVIVWPFKLIWSGVMRKPKTPLAGDAEA